MSKLELQLRGYRLTTAEITYRLPDYRDILQTYVWQNLDLAPEFPVLKKFLDFWDREIEGPIHSVKIASAKIVSPSEMRFVASQYGLH